MCGIAGIYAPTSQAEVARVETMLVSMSHRGPDDSGLACLADGRVAFGHLRLSILDLSPLGHQPMAGASKRAWIVYNGEIYNFREIRDELRSLGASFASESDTEVVLAAYEQWGLSAVDRFRGMFAFAIWDATAQRLHLCRDRFGVKPLYYSLRQGCLAFASEMKALVLSGQTGREVDASAVADFVQYGYISAPSSIFSDVRSVRPGTICTVDPQLHVVERQYWAARELFDSTQAATLRAELCRLPDEDLLDRTEDSLRDAFAYRMVADVPVGVFLSGGIDSSLVATLLTRRAGFKLKTFTIGFGGSEFDETPYARRVAETLGADHVEFDVSPRAVIEAAAKLSDIADEPIGDSSLVPTFLVSRLARQHVKVALSADGADELFGGYSRYSFCSAFLEKSPLVQRLYGLSAELMDVLPPAMIARAYALTRHGGPKFAAINDKLRKFVRMTRATSEFDAYDAAISEWDPRQVSGLVSAGSPARAEARSAYLGVQGIGVKDRFMHFDIVRYLAGDLLTKVDRASMAVSLEAREPFLDHEMAKVAAALGSAWKMRGQTNKYVLRRLLYRHFPRQLFDRPKQGFTAPVADWLRGPLRSNLLDSLSHDRVRSEGMLDPHAVSLAVKAFLAGSDRSTSGAGIWILFQLQQWAAHWRHTPSRVL